MPAVIPFIPLIAAAGTATAGAIMQNQQVQHAKGAAQAQAKAADDKAKEQGAIGPAAAPASPDTSNAVLAAESAQRRKTAMRAGLMSTIGKGGTGAPSNPIKPPTAFGGGTKTTLG